MPLSLNLIIGSIVTVIAVIVAATCVTITLVFFSNEIDTVGRGWALGMNRGVFEKIKGYMSDRESSLYSAASIAQTQGNALPSELHYTQGRNWTNIWLNTMLMSMVKLDYNYNSLSMIFNDYWWMYSAPSFMIGYPAFMIEWIEFFNATGPGTFGGLRFWKDNASLIPYDASTNYQPEGVPFVFTKPSTTTSFQGLKFYIEYLKSLLPDPTKPVCLATDVGFGYYPEKNSFWEQFLFCSIPNSTAVTLGYFSLSLAVDRQYKDLVAAAPRSKNGHIFVIDGKGFLLSATTSESYFTIRFANLSEPVPAGCGNTASQPLLAQPRMGCRHHYSNYTFYEPLAVLEPEFVLAPILAEKRLEVGGKEYIIFSDRYLSERTGLTFNVVTFVPRDDLLDGVDEGRNMAIGIAAALLVAGIVAAVVIVYFTLLPLTDLAEKMEKTARLEGLDKDEELGGDDDSTDGGQPRNKNGANLDEDEQQNLTLASASMIKEIANLEVAYAFSHNQLVNFTRYVPKNVVKEVLIKGGQNMDKMMPTHVTTSFLDIAGFTSIIEKLHDNDSALSSLLRSFFKRMTRLVMAHGGIVDRFVGDCVVSIWGAPFKVERHELLGTLCAIACQRETTKNPLRKIFADLGIPLGIRVGVASGQVLAGNIGSCDRKAYTVLGEPVAVADRLEAYNKHWGTVVMVSEEVARECNDELVLRLLTRIKLAGRAKPVMCYEAMGVQPDAKLNNKKRGNSSPKNKSKSSVDYNNSGSIGDSGSSSDGSSDMSSPTSSSLNDSGSFMSSQSKSLTDLLSASSLGSHSSGGSGFLPTNVKYDKLLVWHKKRNACDEGTVNFANEFNEAARSVIDHDFASALKKLNALETDNWVSEKWKTHKSVGILKDLIKKAMQDGGSITGGGAGSTHRIPHLINDGTTPNPTADFFVKVE